MSNAEIVMAAQIIQPACKDEPDLVERIRKAMKEAQTYWASTDDNIRFTGALGAVLLETKDLDEKERLETSIQAIKNLGALMSGVPVDLDKMVAELDKVEILPLHQMWQDVKKESSP